MIANELYGNKPNPFDNMEDLIESIKNPKKLM